MRKTLIQPASSSTTASATDSLELSTTALLEHAAVELTSEDAAFPIEGAFKTAGNGWRAGTPGPQTIRLRFDPPVSICEVQVRIDEREQARSQEFAIYAETSAASLREIVRQQFTFSPGGATEELEHYTPNLAGVTVLELRIDPDRSHNPADSRTFASLAALRLA